MNVLQFTHPKHGIRYVARSGDLPGYIPGGFSLTSDASKALRFEGHNLNKVTSPKGRLRDWLILSRWHDPFCQEATDRIIPASEILEAEVA
ncbi:hypothetical protein [Litorimonas haliclonae]|uniref:hypothetical protein n=1 Tax=Litorimonas haliclonae TaxID=2081977 RepID=UPI0039EF868D